jgi:hypothetical protein
MPPKTKKNAIKTDPSDGHLDLPQKPNQPAEDAADLGDDVAITMGDLSKSTSAETKNKPGSKRAKKEKANPAEESKSAVASIKPKKSVRNAKNKKN